MDGYQTYIPHTKQYLRQHSRCGLNIHNKVAEIRWLGEQIIFIVVVCGNKVFPGFNLWKWISRFISSRVEFYITWQQNSCRKLKTNNKLYTIYTVSTTSGSRLFLKNTLFYTVLGCFGIFFNLSGRLWYTVALVLWYIKIMYFGVIGKYWNLFFQFHLLT